jgi:sugar/nucleoside kinase (ribokinase family)
VIVAGEEDLPQGFRWDGWLKWAPVLIVTQGREGARMRWKGTWYAIPAYPTHEVDPTGAGDVFVAAYLVRYHETGDPFQAALFASCAASFSVEAPGSAGIPTRAQVKQRLLQQAGLICTSL